MKTIFYLNCFLCILQYSEGRSVDIQNALVYLSKYGYLKANRMGNSAYSNENIFNESLRKFQEFAGIPITGKMDDETIKMMSMPRCGMKDIIAGDSNKESSSYKLHGSRWRQFNLRYKITKYASRLKKRTVYQTIRKAFSIWAKYIPLTFEPTTNRENIDIRFARGNHGDGAINAFGGPRGALAHASYPQYGGIAHFDDDQPWTLNGGRGYDLLQVATHEFGHSLGLDHSRVGGSVMYPYYVKYIPNFDLSVDDIKGIQRLYGKRREAPQPKPRTPNRRRRRRYPKRFLERLVFRGRQV